VPGKANKEFLRILRETKPFLAEAEISRLEKKYGEGTLEFVEALIVENLVSHSEACRLFSNCIEYAYVDPFASVVTPEALDKVPAAIARKAQVLPLYLINDVITIAFSDPADQAMVNRLSGITGLDVSPVFALPSEIRDAIEMHYATEEDVRSIINELAASSDSLIQQFSTHDIVSLSESKGLIRIVDAMLYFAMRERSSDIHIEPHMEQTVVRFRIDGRLREMMRFSKVIHAAIMCRIKIMCDLNIAESRFPHDGRMSMPIGPREQDFRVSVIPTVEGEKCVIRILASTSLLKLDFP